MGLTKLRRSILKKFTPLFQNSSFFLQGQMDISEKSRWFNRDFYKQTGGFYPGETRGQRKIFDLEAWDNTRRDMIVLQLRTVIEKNIQGDFAELGVYRGLTAKLIHHYAPERKLHLFDTFEGFTDRGAEDERQHTNIKVQGRKFADTSVERVRSYIEPAGDNVVFHKGFFPDSIPENFGNNTFAFVHLDADLYEPTFEGLNYFFDRMTQNGIILVHDYNAWPGARKAVDDFFANRQEVPIPMPDKSGSALVVKL